MGGCCCCSFKGGGQNTSPPHYHYPGALEEREPLSSQYTTASASSAALLVDTNLDTSIPDSYRPPPAPLPFFDQNLRRPQTPPGNPQEVGGDNNDAAVLPTNPESVEETAVINVVALEAPVEDKKDTEHISPEDLEIELVKSGELKKSSKSFVADQEVEEDTCPTCLEEYDDENPKINTKCEHHFHLACILEWMERSDTCPVCDQEMVYTV